MRAFGSRCRFGITLKACPILLAALLAGCAGEPTRPAPCPSPVVTEPRTRPEHVPTQAGRVLEGLTAYLGASPSAQEKLRTRWRRDYTVGRAPAAGLRYALALAATATQAGQLKRAAATLQTLIDAQKLEPSAWALARVTLARLRGELETIAAREALAQDRRRLREQLRRARKQLEKLTEIEQSLESQTPETEEPADGRQ